MRRITIHNVTILLITIGLCFGILYALFNRFKSYHLFEAASIDSPLLIQLNNGKLSQLIQDSVSRSLRLDKNEDKYSFNQGYKQLYQLIKELGYEDQFLKKTALLIFEPEGYCGVINMEVKRLNLETLLRFVNGTKIVKNNFKGHPIFQISQKNANQLVLAQFKNLLLWSNHAVLVEAAIDLLRDGTNSFYASTYYHSNKDENNGLAIWTNNRKLVQNGNDLSFLLDPEEISVLRFSFERTSERWEWKGRAWPTTFSQSSSNLPFNMAHIVPAKINQLIHYQSFLNHTKLKIKIDHSFGEHFHKLLEQELNLIQLNTAPILLMRLKKMQALEEWLSSDFLPQSLNYNTFEIRQLSLNQSFQIGNQTISKQPYVLLLDNYMLVSDNVADLELLVDYHISGNNLIEENFFLSLFSAFDRTNFDLLLYESGWSFSKILDQLPVSIGEAFPKENRLNRVVQILYRDENGWIIEGKMSQKKQSTNELDIVWKQTLPNTIIGQPQIIRHNAQNYFILQDANLDVHFYNKDGDKLWQKKLENPILGKWKRIDYYKNNTLQLVGNTKNQLLIIDKAGRAVGPFPLKLENPTLTEATLTSFDQGYSFAIFITGSDGQIYAFDRKGLTYPGWKPNRQIGHSEFSITPLQTAENDFLFIQNDLGTLFTFNRFGDFQFPPIQADTSSNSPVGVQRYMDINRAVSVDKSGKATVISESGESFPLQLQVGANVDVHFIYADITGDDRKEYILLSQDNLTAYSYQKNELEKLYETKLNSQENTLFEIPLVLEKKSVIGILDKTSEKIYLYDAKGSKILGFPIAGSTTMDIAPISNQDQFLLLVGYQDILYVYQGIPDLR